VATRQITDYPTFTISRVCPSGRCFVASNGVYRSMDFISESAVSLEDTFSLLGTFILIGPSNSIALICYSLCYLYTFLGACLL
jgi:hypothetical protein